MHSGVGLNIQTAQADRKGSNAFWSRTVGEENLHSNPMMPQEPILPQFAGASCRKEKPPLLRSERVYVKKLEALLTSLWAAWGWSFQGLHPVAGWPAMVVELGERCRKPGSDDGEPILKKNPGNFAHSSFATVLRPSYSRIKLPLVLESNIRIAKIVTLDFAFVAGKPVKVA